MRATKIAIPCFIDGREVWREDLSRVTHESGDVTVSHAIATEWMAESAIETASRTQARLRLIPMERIHDIIRRAADHLYANPSDVDTVVRLSGSPRSFIESSLDGMRAWMRRIDRYDEEAASPCKIRRMPSAPVVAVLPSNSEVESIYIGVQALLSRNAAILRPSLRQAGAFSSLQWARALRAAVAEAGDRAMEALVDAVAVVNLPADRYLQRLAVDGWNYVVFGSDETLREVRSRFEALGVRPRKVVSFGTGLSMTVVMEDHEPAHLLEVAESVTVNRGNECISTDVLYVHAAVAARVSSALRRALSTMRSGDPFRAGSIGRMTPESIAYVKEQARARGRHADLALEDVDGEEQLHGSILPVHPFESVLEYPGPVASMRVFSNREELRGLIARDMEHNAKRRNLVTSVFTRSRFHEVADLLPAYLVKHNVGTHVFDPMVPHQGVVLFRELSEAQFVQSAHQAPRPLPEERLSSLHQEADAVSA